MEKSFKGTRPKADAEGQVWIRHFKVHKDVSDAVRAVCAERGLETVAETVALIVEEHPLVAKVVRRIRRRRRKTARSANR